MRSTIDVDRLRELRGVMIFDSADDSIGTIDEIFYDEATTRPLWVGVAADRPGTSRMLLPLEAASIGDGGLTLPYTKEYVRRAPAGAGGIGRLRERQLRAYYGLAPRDPSGDIRSLT